jgi:hypothetical protein
VTEYGLGRTGSNQTLVLRRHKPKVQLPVCAASAHHRLRIKSRMQMSAMKMVMRSIIQKLTPTEKTHVGLSRSRLNT